MEREKGILDGEITAEEFLKQLDEIDKQHKKTKRKSMPRMGGAPGIRADNLKITSLGIEYLKDDVNMENARELLKRD